MNKKLLYLCLLIMLSDVVNDPHATAAQFSVDTSKVEATVKAGKTKKLKIKLVNSEEIPLRIKAYVQDMRVKSDGSPDFFELGSTPWSLKEFGIPPVSEFILPARYFRYVKFEITVPANARGGHYGAVLFEGEPKTKPVKGGGSVNVKFRIASLIYVQVQGTTETAAKIQDFKAWREGDKVKARLSVENDGNILIRPQGQVRFPKCAAGAPGDVNPLKFPLMPGTSGQYTLDWPNQEISTGTCEGTVELDYGGAEILGAKTSLE